MKISPEQFGLFKAEVLRLVERWRITGWDLVVVQKEMPNKAAQCEYSITGGRAAIALANEINDSFQPEISDERILYLAAHETMHLLIARSCGLAGTGYITEDEVRAAEEALVNHLLTLVPK